MARSITKVWCESSHDRKDMLFRDKFERLIGYLKRHGLRATILRFGLAFKRMLKGTRLVLFYCDLGSVSHPGTNDSSGLNIERKTARNELAAKDLQKILGVSNGSGAPRQISERFEHGAALWLCKLEDQLVGYGWTIIGRTVKPHFFPLGAADAHLFDFFVFPEYRGRQFNASLVIHILKTLGAEGKRRAFIEAAEWNIAQLRSLSRMPFQQLGRARKFGSFGRLFVIWKNI
jgi:GNAT superfamily N-acetyltransferase